MSEFEQVYQAKTIHYSALLHRRNVVGVGVGYKEHAGRVTDELSVVVLVRNKIPRAALSDKDMIPQKVGGVRTDVVEVGEIRPLNAHTQRWRPAPGGVSLGHYQVTAGTLGCVVRDRASGRRMILSNNHVLANSNDALPGDPILQPGAADGGEVGRDTIGYLERFIPIRYITEPATCNLALAYASLGNWLAQRLGARHRLQAFQSNPIAVNRVDAALALPRQDNDLLEQNLEIGAIDGVAAAELGMEVIKSGRTTGLTNGTITILEASIRVNYGLDRAAVFEGQIVSTPMSQGGDSGSLIVTRQGHRAVGLLFAGSGQATIFNPIQAVLDALKVDIPQRSPRQINQQIAVEKAQAVKQAYEHALLARPNVVGVGVGLRRRGGKRTDEVGLVVMVERKVPKSLLRAEDLIPAEIDGVPVDVREVGQVEAQERFRGSPLADD
jgi:hypothetical protein